jgi:hypothetical protein
MMWRRSLLATASISAIDADDEKTSAFISSAEVPDNGLPESGNGINTPLFILII